MYKFVTNNNHSIQTNLKFRPFSNEWLEITECGLITVKGSNGDGYAWDGCTPKGIALDLIFGTPDGRTDDLTKLPITYFASMFHDALYQFKNEIYLSRLEVDALFLIILKKHNFKLAKVYFTFVRLFGGFFGKWYLKESLADSIEIKKFSYLESF